MKCSEIWKETKKDCQMNVMLEPDYAAGSKTFLDKNGKVSTVSFPLKPATHGLCWYHFNKKQAKYAMARKEEMKRVLP